MFKKEKYTSHDAFDHDSIESLGYDWERTSVPQIDPQPPFKVYLPRTTEHVVRAVKEMIYLKQELVVRSNGHSANNLVLAKDGNILCTQALSEFSEPDVKGHTVRMQSGAIMADVDEKLAKYGLGLPIIGDNNHISSGGFASVGGLSPASHRFGLFVDNIVELEYVDHAGNVETCGHNKNAEQFHRILAGTGRHGIITKLTCKVYEVDKFRALLRNDVVRSHDFNQYVAESSDLLGKAFESGAYPPDDAAKQILFARGMWFDFPLAELGKSLHVGQFNTYFSAKRTLQNTIRKHVGYGYLQFLGRLAGHSPARIEKILRQLGILGIILSPTYGTVKDVETLTDRTVDFAAADPSRLLTVLAPFENYAVVFESLYEKCLALRASGAIKAMTFYIKPIASDYLAANRDSNRYVELSMVLFVQKAMDEKILGKFVRQIDELCIQHDALRYMPTRTTPTLQAKIDPNFRYPQGTPAPRSKPKSKPKSKSGLKPAPNRRRTGFK